MSARKFLDGITILSTAPGGRIGALSFDFLAAADLPTITTLGTVAVGVWNGSALTAAYLPTLDAITAPVADVSLNSHKLTNVVNPTNPQDAATKSYVDSVATGAMTYKGAIDCSGSPNYPAAAKGDSYLVSVAGKIGGASGVAVDAGDLVVCDAANAGGTQAAVGADWFILEHNLVGALLAANNLADVASAPTAFNNLSGMTVLGQLLYGGVAGARSVLGGNATATRKFLRQVGDGTNSAAPAWDTLQIGDVPTLNQSTTGNAATATALQTARQISGVAFDGTANITIPKGDMLATFANAANALTNPSATTLSASARNVITATSASSVKMPSPTAGVVVGIWLAIGSNSLCTILPSASELLDGQASLCLFGGAASLADGVAPLPSVVLWADGTNWYIAAERGIPRGDAPLVPGALSAGGGTNQITYAWSAPSSGPTPTGYVLYVSTSSTFSSAVSLYYFGATATSGTAPGLTNGTTYWGKLRAVYNGVFGPANAAVSAVPVNIRVYDTFTAAGGTVITTHTPDVGGPWSIYLANTATPTIQGNALSCDASVTSLSWVQIDATVSDYTISAQFNTAANSDGYGFLCRMTTPGATLNGLLIRYVRSGGSASLQINDFNGTSGTLIASAAVTPFVAPYILMVSLSGSSVTLSATGVGGGSASGSTSASTSRNQTSTKVGVYPSGTAGASLDNFTVFG